MALGAWLGIALAVLVPWHDHSFVGWVLVHGALVAPTLVQPWLQAKLYKICARTLLGAASASWILGAVEYARVPEPEWAVRCACLVWIAVATKALLILRERKSDNPCLRCPLGVYPTCEWNLPRLLAENADEGLLHALLATRGRAESGAELVATASGSGPQR